MFKPHKVKQLLAHQRAAYEASQALKTGERGRGSRYKQGMRKEGTSDVLVNMSMASPHSGITATKQCLAGSLCIAIPPA
jgi:hypothetical protein